MKQELVQREFVEPLPAEPVTRRFVRPTKYALDISRRVCDRLMEGVSLRKLCEEPQMPGRQTVLKWLHTVPQFREDYYHARRVQAEGIIDDILDIADDKDNDWKMITLANGTTKIVADNEAIQRSRVRIDTRKWVASKMIPQLYGEKAIQEHTVTGDLAKLLGQAINRDIGLPNK